MCTMKSKHKKSVLNFMTLVQTYNFSSQMAVVQSQDKSVSIVTGHSQDNRGLIPGWDRGFSSLLPHPY